MKIIIVDARERLTGLLAVALVRMVAALPKGEKIGLPIRGDGCPTNITVGEFILANEKQDQVEALKCQEDESASFIRQGELIVPVKWEESLAEFAKKGDLVVFASKENGTIKALKKANIPFTQIQ